MAKIKTVTPVKQGTPLTKLAASSGAQPAVKVSKPSVPGASSLAQPSREKVHFIFTRLNYQVMFAGMAIIAFGFILMSGTTDIMSPVKIVVAPVVVLLGFATEFVAIFINPKRKEE